MDDDLRLLEAVIFASAEPLAEKELAGYLPGRDVPALLEQLRRIYSARGVVLVERQKHWVFRTAPDLAAQLGKLTQAPRRLTRASTEVLSIIAYHQPVTRGEIEQIRGVAFHKGALDTLVQLGWVKPGRRRETLGRPLTWVTTTAFLDHFSLSSITDLPGLDELRANGLLDARPAKASLFDRLEERQSEAILDS